MNQPQPWFCPKCGHQNQPLWNACQMCRVPNPYLPAPPPVQPKPKSSKGLLIVIIGFLGLCAVCGLAGLVGVRNTPRTATVESLASGTPSNRGVTMANYNRIQTGMSYYEVTIILGVAGKELSSNQIGNLKTIMYEWKGDSLISSMNVTFQNDKVISKAQFGLE